MKIKKIAAVSAAFAAALSMTAVSVSADDPIVATLGFADADWFPQDWESSVEITGDGTYTLTSTVVAGSEDYTVFVVDCVGMYAAYPDATATLDSIEIDGSEIDVDTSKILYGDIEEKGNYRIEIYNMYGDSKDDPGVNSAQIINESLSVTFTVSGMGGASEESPADEAAPASDSGTTTAAATGNSSALSLAAVMAVSAAAAFAVKKSSK